MNQNPLGEGQAPKPRGNTWASHEETEGGIA